MMIIDWCDYY